MANPNPLPKQPLFSQKTEFVRWLMMYPALSVMVFTRRKLGYRMVKSSWLIILAVLLFLYADLADYYSHPFSFLSFFTTQQAETGWSSLDFLLRCYIWAMLALGFFQQWRSWRDISRGVRWHSYCAGISYLEFLPLPRFLTLYRRVYRQLEPLLVFLIGKEMAALCWPLGWWLMFCAVALYFFEQTLYERQLEQDLDMLDSMIASEVQAEVVKYFENPETTSKQFRLEETAGIPTGLAPDIHKQIEMRKIRQGL